MFIKSNKVVSSAFKWSSLLIGVIFFSFICSGDHVFAASTVAETSPGFFQQYFVQPFASLLNMVASWFGGSYGLSVIFVTLLIRLLLMPSMLKSTKNQYQMKDKMAVAQPEIKIIQEKLKKATTDEQKIKLQQELMAVYKKYDINPMASLAGCLPILIQMPILMGFYYAIRDSVEIATQNFLWFNLGQPDMLMAILAGAVYYVQYKLSMKGLPEDQQKQMAIIGMISPIMMGLFSLTAPAALPLYWAVGGCFLMVQTYISRKLYTSVPDVQEVKS